ncbi:MAG: methyl-accepting chemotaxis protein [Gemmatimonadaceae bacterium]
MTLTIGRRITLGFALVLLLVALVAVGGYWALRHTSQTYAGALEGRRTLLGPAIAAESEIRAANVEDLRYLLDGTQTSIVAKAARLAKAQELIDGIIATVPAQSAGPWRSVDSLTTAWSAASDEAAAQSRAGNATEVKRIRTTRVQPAREELDRRIAERVEWARIYSDSIEAAGKNAATGAQTSLLWGLLLALLAGVAATWLLSRSINRPLQETSSVIASRAAETLAAATEQAAGTNESMAAITETVATVDEVAQTANQAALRAKAVADSAQRAADSARQGRKAIADTTAAMAAVEGQVGSIAERIVALADQAQAIGEIITAVSDIAEQTKLLALNAAVESARAGEHGRGFGVVASEIKALASQAKQSTTQVRQILGDIQRATSAAVMTTEQGTKQVAIAAGQAKQTGEIMNGLAETVNDAAQAAAQIVASAGQQAIGMGQIRQAIANIHDATQQNLTATRQSEQAAQDLNRLGTRLVNLVGGSASRAGARGD